MNFGNLEECKEQIFHFPEAKYKSFITRKLVGEAWKGNSKDYIGKTFSETILTKEQLEIIGKTILNSISVDGAGNTNTGFIEYQGVNTKTKEKLFHQGPYPDGTNNIAEFLGLVHALAYCKQNSLNIPIYTDSKTAISWVKYKKAKTKQEKTQKNEKLFQLLDRAEKWLQENEFKNEILKWETTAWGKIPADFGRK